MRLEIFHWTPHQNMLIYSYLYFCEENNIEFNVRINPKISWNGAVLFFNNKTFYFDYSDDAVFLDNPKRYNFYFKRSLKIIQENSNIFPLNLQVNYSYKSLKLLTRLDLKVLSSKANRIEIIRALDYCNIFTNLSHNAIDVRKLPNETKDNDGKVIFFTRLWNPDNHIDVDEKERRKIQNEFRIESCRIIKKNFKNSAVGLFPDSLSSKLAPDLLLDSKKTSSKEYFALLRQSNIGIADDGLKDTPGWKIGEYLLFGKAVITTPINIVVDNFYENTNYEKVSDRSAYLELPEKIELLMKDKKYIEIGQNNLYWSREYLHPKNYIKKLLCMVYN